MPAGRPTDYTPEKAIEMALENYEAITESGCWVWLGATHPQGCGTIKLLGKNFLMHRLMFARVNGYIPHGKVVRHTCDIPSCINPRHLVAGTQKDNINDMVSRGRGSWQK